MATTTATINSTLHPAETGYHDMALVHARKHGNAAAFQERYSEIIQFRANSQFLTWLTRITHLAFKHEKKPASIGAAQRVFVQKFYWGEEPRRRTEDAALLHERLLQH
jgi:hypothetical protein